MQLIFRVIQFSMCFRAFYTVLIKSQPLTTRSFSRHFLLWNVRRLYVNLNYPNITFVSIQAKYFFRPRLTAFLPYQGIVVGGYPYIHLRLMTFLPKLTLVRIDLALTFFFSHYFIY